MDWSAYPFLRFLCFFCMGICVSYYLASYYFLLIISCSAILLLTLFCHLAKQVKTTALLLPLAIIALGSIHHQLSLKQQISLTENDYHQTGTFHVYLSQLLYENSYQKTYIAEIIASDIVLPKCKLKLSLAHTEAYTLGDGLEISGLLVPLYHESLPGLFDYATWLSGQGVLGELKGKHFQRIAIDIPFSIQLTAKSIQAKIAQKINLLPLQASNIAFIKAIIIGDKKGLEKQQKHNFQKAGVIHILAVSGMHTGFIYLILCFLFRIKTKRSTWQFFKKIVVLLFLWSFALISGFQAAVIRACTMFSLFLLTGFLKRKVPLAHQIYLSAFLLLLYQPDFLFDAGFQLSYSALLGICFIYPLLENQWKFSSKIGRYLFQLLSVSLAAQLGTLAVSLYYFHQFPSYFLLSNLIVLPLLPLCLYSSLFLLLLQELELQLRILSQMTDGILSFLQYITAHIASWPYALSMAIYPTFAQCILLIFFKILCCYAWYRKEKKWIKYLLGCILCLQFLQLKKELVSTDALVVCADKNQHFFIKEKEQLYSPDSTSIAPSDWNKFLQKEGISEWHIQANDGAFIISSSYIVGKNALPKLLGTRQRILLTDRFTGESEALREANYVIAIRPIKAKEKAALQEYCLQGQCNFVDASRKSIRLMLP